MTATVGKFMNVQLLREAWASRALPYVKRGRALRLLVLGIGLPLSLVLADVPRDFLQDELFLFSFVLFLVATGLT